jgi:tetratricopeptide (TPR) repeat protein
MLKEKAELFFTQAGTPLTRTARPAQRTDQEPAQRVSNDAAPGLRPKPKRVWKADGSDAPAALEPGAPADLVAFHRGYMCARGGLFEQARDLFREAVALKPDDAVGHYNLGAALAETGQLREAIAPFRKAIKLKPDFAGAHYELGRALAETGQLREAIAPFRKAIKLKPDHVEAHYELADAHYELGFALSEMSRFREAIAPFRKAIKLKPDFAEPHYELGLALSETGQLREAIAPFREAVKLKPDFAVAHYNLGVALGETGQFREAIAVLRKKPRTTELEQQAIALLIKEYVKKQKEFEFAESQRWDYNPELMGETAHDSHESPHFF